MDAGTPDSLTWFSMVKGCHYHLSQIAYRQGNGAEAALRRRLCDEMQAYLKDGYGILEALRKDPRNPEALSRRAALFSRYRLPPKGVRGKDAAARWIPDAAS